MTDLSYRRDLEDVLEELCEVMADLEDARDEIQEMTDGEAAAAADLKRVDEALRKLEEAAELLEEGE